LITPTAFMSERPSIGKRLSILAEEQSITFLPFIVQATDARAPSHETNLREEAHDAQRTRGFGTVFSLPRLHIAGKELTCAVVGDNALGVIEIVPAVKSYD